MKLENQVVSLELARKLKELGVKQESLFVMYNFGKDGHYEIGQWNESAPHSYVYPNSEIISAFTVAELGEMLPDEYFAHQCKTLGGHTRIDFGDEQMVNSNTEADARAKMLIYLLENNLLTLPT